MRERRGLTRKGKRKKEMRTRRGINKEERKRKGSPKLQNKKMLVQ